MYQMRHIRTTAVALLKTRTERDNSKPRQCYSGVCNARLFQNEYAYRKLDLEKNAQRVCGFVTCISGEKQVEILAYRGTLLTRTPPPPPKDPTVGLCLGS